jgi:hypothetical protein
MSLLGIFENTNKKITEEVGAVVMVGAGMDLWRFLSCIDQRSPSVVL